MNRVNAFVICFVPLALFLVVSFILSPHDPHASGSIRILEGDDEEEYAGTLLAQVSRENGAHVEFYEPQDGQVVVVSTARIGEDDPLKDYLSKSGRGRDVAGFYKSISAGHDPPAALTNALKRKDEHKSNKKVPYLNKDEHMDDDEEDEDGQEVVDEVGDDHDRKLSHNWFLQNVCRWTKEIQWCRCRTHRSGGSSYTKTDDDYFYTVAAYRGNVMARIQREYYYCPSCTGWGCFFKECTGPHMLTLVEISINEGFYRTLWASADKSWMYRGEVYNAGGDGYHWVAYDLKDTDNACQYPTGEGCYICGDNDVW